nr:hypothetical protein BaRGS_019170 [Batillaria attramentaria]
MKLFLPGHEWNTRRVWKLGHADEHEAEDVQTQNKLAAEMVDALNARMSLIKKFVDELELVTFPAFYRADINQNNDINNLWGHLNDLMTKLDDLMTKLDDLMTKLDELQNAVMWLETQNGDNSNHIRYLENAWVSNKEHDVSQDGNVAKLHVAAKDFKSKLFTVLCGFN